MLATVGAVIILLSVLPFLHNVLRSRKKGELAGDDPWDGRTLEWSIPSPPPEYNFAEIPTVHGRDSFWEEKEERRRINSDTEGTGLGESVENHGSIHMPSPSYWPLFTAIGVALIGGGLLSHYALSFVGGIIAMVGTVAWANEPPSAPSDHH